MTWALTSKLDNDRVPSAGYERTQLEHENSDVLLIAVSLAMIMRKVSSKGVSPVAHPGLLYGFVPNEPCKSVCLLLQPIVVSGTKA